jgi:ribonuclease VapC
VIAVDTSALMAIALREEKAAACLNALDGETDIVISAATVAEALIVAGGRRIPDEMARLIDSLGAEIVAVTDAVARRVADAHRKWGRGAHPAALNFGDCFAYEVAKQHGCALLFVGDDFSKTDLERVI